MNDTDPGRTMRTGRRNYREPSRSPSSPFSLQQRPTVFSVNEWDLRITITPRSVGGTVTVTQTDHNSLLMTNERQRSDPPEDNLLPCILRDDDTKGGSVSQGSVKWKKNGGNLKRKQTENVIKVPIIKINRPSSFLFDQTRLN